MRTAAFATLAVVLAAVHGCGPGDPSPEALAKMAAKIENGTFEKLDVRGSFDRSKTLTTFRFQLLYTGGQDVAAFITDPEDRTPLVAMVGDTTLIYDILSNSLLLTHGTRPMMTVTPEEVTIPKTNPPRTITDVTLNFSPDLRPDDPAAPPLVVKIDLPAIFAAHLEMRAVTRVDHGGYEWSGVSGPGRVTAVIETGQRVTPVDRFTHEMGNNSGFRLTLDTIHLNGEVNYRVHPLPDAALLAKQFHLVEAKWQPGMTIEEKNKGLNELYRRAVMTVGLRYALRHPEVRLMAQERFGPVDWETLEKNVPSTTERLRMLVRLPAPAEPLER